MQKVVIDTNVLVSAFIQRGYPYFIINLFLTKNTFHLCISDDLFAEYYDVFNRKKFARYPDFINRAEMLLVYIEEKAYKYNPKI